MNNKRTDSISYLIIQTAAFTAKCNMERQPQNQNK